VPTVDENMATAIEEKLKVVWCSFGGGDFV
jgi:hypothetical protein